MRRISHGLDLHGAKLGDGVVLVWSPVFARAQADAISAELAAIVDSSDDAVISMTLDGQVVSWNRGSEQIYGYTAEDAVGAHISFLQPPGREAEIPAMFERVGRGERVNHFETVRRTKDASLVDVSITYSPILNSSGRLIGASSIARDVTDRKHADTSDAHLAAIVDSCDDAVIGATLDGQIESWNRSAERIYGYTAEEAIGRNIALLLASGRDAEAPAILARLALGERIDHYETVFQRQGREPDRRVGHSFAGRELLRNGHRRVVGLARRDRAQEGRDDRCSPRGDCRFSRRRDDQRHARRAGRELEPWS